jgi:hypothetical protein
MDVKTVIWAICFPLLLFFIAVGVGVAFAITNSDSIGFLVAKVCFTAAAFVFIAATIYWVMSIRESVALKVAVPTIVAVIAVPALVLSLQWLNNIEVKLSARLFPGNESTPPLPNPGVEIPKDALMIFFGSNISWASKMPHTLIVMAGEKIIEIDRDKSRNEIIISTLKVFDDRNNIIARMDADGFWVDNSTRKKRHDKSTLVVYDHSDTEVVRVVLLNRNTLSITGVFRHSRVAKPVIITSDRMNLGGVQMSNNMMGENAIDITINASN